MAHQPWNIEKQLRIIFDRQLALVFGVLSPPIPRYFYSSNEEMPVPRVECRVTVGEETGPQGQAQRKPGATSTSPGDQVAFKFNVSVTYIWEGEPNEELFGAVRKAFLPTFPLTLNDPHPDVFGTVMALDVQSSSRETDSESRENSWSITYDGDYLLRPDADPTFAFTRVAGGTGLTPDIDGLRFYKIEFNPEILISEPSPLSPTGRFFVLYRAGGAPHTAFVYTNPEQTEADALWSGVTQSRNFVGSYTPVAGNGAVGTLTIAQL